MAEVYVSTDIETDGPIPGPHSMLSFASAAFFADKTLVDTFTANLHTLPDASPDPSTLEWWRNHPEAYQATRQNPESPERAMRRYVDWLNGLPGKPVFVAYPAAFDFLFVYWYLIRFAGESPFSFSALDIKTYAMAMLRTEFRQISKRTLPAQWFDSDQVHNHVALDDALEQGMLFCNMLAENRLGR
jgi:hypothetical protein